MGQQSLASGPPAEVLTPKAVAEWTEAAAGNGMKAIIAAAGGAAHLAGVLAAQEGKFFIRNRTP